MKRLLAVSVLAIVAGCAEQNQPSKQSPQPQTPWMNRALSAEQRATLLVKQMTLDEKVLEIHMLDVKEHPRQVAGIPRLGIPPFRITNGPAGAGPGDARPTAPATALPSAIALAASWDPSLAKQFGQIAGEEVADRGEDLIEAPGVNITRVPQNGRNFEYFGEDPWLSGQMGVAEIQAIQQQGVIAEVKHFACNNQETDRKSVNEIVDQRTLREIYLPAFEASIKLGGAAAVMAAYPSVNGQFCSQNTQLLHDILRGEWGFKGFVQSDYTGTRNAVLAANAGLDLAMQPVHYSDEMKAAVASGQVSQSTLDALLIRRFATMFRFGMFDHFKTPKPIPAEKDGAISCDIAAQCAVLLKNDGSLLPLRASDIHSIALIGPYAGAAHTGGGGSSAVKALYTVTPVDGIKRRVGSDVNVVYDNGSNLESAAEAAKHADIVLLMVGNKDSEGRDRPNLSLPNKQDALISAVAAANPHTVVVLKTGGPVLMPWLSQVSAVLEAWYPGEEDGNVVAKLVFGDVNPSGKLPMTFPQTQDQVPAHAPEQYPGVNGTAVYSEKLEVGYRWYDAQHVAPLYPFGYGLSYTTFKVSNLSVGKYGADGRVSVAMDVTNTGGRSGAEVVQVYVAAPSNAGEPPKQLAAMAKVMLKPGHTQHVKLWIGRRTFSIWNVEQNAWTVVPGQYEILAGDSSRDLPLHRDVEVAAK